MPVKLERIKSGIPGLDELMEGGFAKGHTTLLCGSYGTGKTTFAMQFLAYGAAHGEPGLYISFEEEPDQLIEEGNAFGWDLDPLVADQKLKVIKMVPQELLNLVEAGFGQVSGVIKSMGVKRIVVDSIILFDLLGKDEYERRKYALDFVTWLKKHECTALLTIDSVPGVDMGPHVGIAESAADGLIALYHPQEKKGRTRSIEIIKMRETCHADSVFDFEITKQGIVIKSGAAAIKCETAGSAAKAKTVKMSGSDTAPDA